MFKRLKIDGWRQYENIDIIFHSKLTVITGANSAGKTTLLNILNQNLNSPVYPYVGTPKLSLNGLNYYSSIWRPRINNSPIPPYQNGSFDTNQFDQIGNIEYYNEVSLPIIISKNTGSTYGVQIQGMQPVKGFAIASNRPTFKYEAVTHIPTSLTSKEQSYNNYKNASNSRFYGHNNNNNKNETYFIKETLISWAAFGPGNGIVTQNDKAIALFNGFEAVLKKVLPETLGFKAISIRIPEVVLNTETGEFPIDAVSGGVASIIDLAWQIYMYDNGGFPFVVTIDEPENHLHPAIQKNLLPNLISAFPHCQFIVATHSPFIISSIAESNAYALKYDGRNKVVSVLLDRINKAGTANEILREVLGLEDTMPNWVDDKIDSIIESYKDIGINKENVDGFKKALTEAGLGKYIPASLVKLIEESKK